MNCNVTIGIPLYNSRSYILHTFLSVLEQTYPSIEILVVDDCSIDGSLDIVKELQKCHPLGGKIRIIKQPYNKGVSSARNLIIDEACGHYLFFLDSDDYIIGNNVISRMVSQAQQVDADLVIGSYEKRFINQKRKELYQYENALFEDVNSFALYAFRKYGGVQASACNYLMNLSFVRSTKIRFFETDFLEDLIFTYELTTYVKKVVTLSDITYCYQFHEGSLSHDQLRDMIPKHEIESTINGISYLKGKTTLLKNKPYLTSMMCNLLKTDFYIICAIIRNENRISPPFSGRELKAIMFCPLSMTYVLKLRVFHLWILVFYLLSVLPSSMFVSVIRNVGKRKGLI